MDELPEGKMCFCRSNALIPCSFCDSKINIYIYWLSRLWIYHYGLPLSIICLQLTMCTFSFFCEILLHKYHIDSKQVRVSHSRVCQQTSFLAMAISKYGHWRGGASQDWQAPKIIYSLCNSLRNDVASMETYSSWMNCPKEKCVSADLTHLFLVRFVTVRSTYIFIDYPDCEYTHVSLFWIRRL
jgi:hypothetical protein